jgi:hypothetical protein
MEQASRRAEASRRNGSRGGVKTAKGKAITRLNALRHGFFSRHLVLRNQWVKERQIDFDRLLAELQADREPIGVEENLAIRQLAIAYWRLMTLQRAERQLIERQLEQVNVDARSYIDGVDKTIHDAIVGLRWLKWQKFQAASVKEGTIDAEEFERACKLDLLCELKGLKRDAPAGRGLCKHMSEELRVHFSNASPSDKASAFKLYEQWLEFASGFFHDFLLEWKREKRVRLERVEPFLDPALIPSGPEGERLIYYKERLRKQIHRWHLRLYALQNARLNKSGHQCPEARVMYISPPNNSAEEEKERED